jgi:hypothetical protein
MRPRDLYCVLLIEHPRTDGAYCTVRRIVDYGPGLWKLNMRYLRTPQNKINVRASDNSLTKAEAAEPLRF